MNRVRLASGLVPPLTALVLLYHVLAELQVTVLRVETLLVIAVPLTGAVIAGVLAAWGGPRMRVLMLSATVLCWIDVAFDLPGLFDRLTPDTRASAARDRQRVRDILQIQRALDVYIARFGNLPRPTDYGEEAGFETFWQDWWDVSSEDRNGNGQSFLDFLVEHEILPAVPVDPINEPSIDGHPARGRQYVYFVVPPGYIYQGGVCEANVGFSTYLLGVTRFERGRGGAGTDPDCSCLWRDKPDFFEEYFDYLVCGRFGP